LRPGPDERASFESKDTARDLPLENRLARTKYEEAEQAEPNEHFRMTVAKVSPE
jgi:hypothetical protein